MAHGLGALKTYLINLKTSRDRYESAKAQLDQAGIAFEYVPAFDGRKSDPGSFSEYDAKRAFSWFGRELSGAELGCYFSHIDCVKRFLASGAQYGLSLEDDLKLMPDAAETIEQLLTWFEAGNAPGWYMVNLGRPVKRFESRVGDIVTADATHILCRAHYFPDTTTAILWSREGATRFLDAATPIFAPVDHFLRYWNTNSDAGYGFVTPPITTTGAESDILRAPTGQRKSVAPLYAFRKHRRLFVNKWRAKRHRDAFQARSQPEVNGEEP